MPAFGPKQDMAKDAIDVAIGGKADIGVTGGLAKSTEDFAANLDLFPLRSLLLPTVLRTT